METIKCLKPILLINPSFRCAVMANYYHGIKVVVLGREYFVSYSASHGDSTYFTSDGDFKDWLFLPKKLGVTSSIHLQYCYYIVDGNFYPLYIAVPCNHCALCNAHKREDWASRAELETMSSASLPLFATFTYDENHVPTKRICKVTRNGHKTYNLRVVSKRDVQLMLKRLRHAIERNLVGGSEWLAEHPLRYLLVSEYGSNGTHRPHYHVIFWNFPPPRLFNVPENVFSDELYISAIKRFLHEPYYYKIFRSYKNTNKTIIHKAMPVWDKCMQCRIDVDFCGVKVIRNSNGEPIQRITTNKGKVNYSAKYAAKYISKCGDVPHLAEKNFRLASNRGGGIGVPFVKQYFKYLRDTMNPFIEFTDKNNVFRKILLPDLVKRHLFPSPSYLRSGRLTELMKDVYSKFQSYYYFATFCLSGIDQHPFLLDEINPLLPHLFRKLYPQCIYTKVDVFEHIPYIPKPFKPVDGFFVTNEDIEAYYTLLRLFRDFRLAYQELLMYTKGDLSLQDYFKECTELLRISQSRKNMLSELPLKEYDVEELNRLENEHYKLYYTNTQY